MKEFLRQKDEVDQNRLITCTIIVMYFSVCYAPIKEGEYFLHSLINREKGNDLRRVENSHLSSPVCEVCYTLKEVQTIPNQ